MRALKSIAGVVAALALGTGLVATSGVTPADAANGPVLWAKNKRASGYFKDYGDQFVVTDRDGDGRGAVLAYFHAGRADNIKFHAVGGYGNTKTFDHAFGEGTKLSYIVCLSKRGSSTVDWGTCGTWHNRRV